MNRMNRMNLVARFNAKMLAKLGLNDNQAQLAAYGSAGADVEEIKEEMQTESQMIAEESKDFIPLYKTLDDFRDEDTYSNMKDESAIYQKNPVYKNVKPRLGRMVIDKSTGERRIIHDDENINK